jgi:hypothetical protein
MARFNGMLLLAGLFAACGGEGTRNDQPATAGVAGTTPNASGATGQGSGGSAQSPGGSAGAHAIAGSGGRAGASSGAGMAGGGAASGGASGGGISGSGGTPSSSGAGGAVSTPEMLVPTVKAYCAAARTCCAKQSDPVHLDDCESAFATRDQTSQGLRRGTVTIDAVDLAKCQAAYEAAATSCEENSVLDACAGIVHGKVAEGGACLLSQECAGSGPRVCLVTGGQDTPGVCKATPGGKVGDLCSLTCRPHEICSFTVYGISDSSLTPCLESDGVFCSRDVVPAKCQAIHAIGAQCENDDQCGFLGYCDSQTSHTCKKRGQLNEACGTCIASLMCKDGKCQSPPLTVGGTCDGYSLGPY